MAGYDIGITDINTRGKSGAKNYTEFTSSLGLIGRIAGACRVTRFGKVLLHFLTLQRKDNAFNLSLAERYQYLYWLTVKDSDRFLTVMNLVARYEDAPLKCLQDEFQSVYVGFLDHRITTEDERTARDILSLRNSVTHQWKSPQRYAESIVPPRVNWLVDLGLATIAPSHQRSVRLTQSGHDVLNHLPRLPNSELRYVNQSWVRNEFFSSVGPAIARRQGELWKDAAFPGKDERLLSLLILAFKVLRGSPTPKVSLLPVLLFIATSLATEGLWIETKELREELENMARSGAIPFDVRFSHRENESYVICRPA